MWDRAVRLAASAAVAGPGAALGLAGVGLGALLVFLLGNPLSGVAAAPEVLPQPWGEVGQWLPVGAGGTLLRSVAWFGGAGATQALWVLTGWVLTGWVLTGWVLTGWVLTGWVLLGGALVLVGRAQLYPTHVRADRGRRR